MPILPVLNTEAKFAPLSAWAFFRIGPSFHISLSCSSTCLTPSPVSASSLPLAGRIFEPAAAIIREAVKMLQPGGGAQEIEAIDVGPERADLLRVLMDLNDRARRQDSDCRLVGARRGRANAVVLPRV
jgi:hypothetical protein